LKAGNIFISHSNPIHKYYIMEKSELRRFITDFLIENEKEQNEIQAMIAENNKLIQERFGSFGYNHSKVLKIVHSNHR